ncbi:cysteine--tRNA ligase [Pelagibacterium halotolerans]|uniref:Cysteine--tRNA ligase n=1 Tax=Pelagibacterium halotolerans (strain DSM 22347 / JCM 15775 / CGMCC 1.7692 / B2) TaxID=1082931 RepID=G4RF59_PELHB|nr:cysteine--tRNA ligase [Pelagibacterium halotolerans]AEQ50927.1 cysteinyl-tRNA synthetase [Pelagibacterium halotolerans B2]QJR19172.1 cysteine--tRNA ligase [Pelagibacterium halotolerans]SEA00164.1 cysteinyl-tRNA synthetase [Pelagibacterium halotolerans]
MPSQLPTLKLHNTLTRTKQDFVPIDGNNVRMYVCGPTVYDFAHIGNARPVIVFDVLFRLLRHLYGDENVTYVRNITDVDDKINARALRDHPDLPLNDAIRKVTEKTATQFEKDVAALGCLPPSVEPRATEHIEGMVAIIERLVAKGHAYEAGGEVLFRVSSMADYGKLSGRNLEDNIAGARVAVETHKENPADFVLWKASSENEPGWESPWGRGRPGWHIECSAMSEALLGETFDIHGGGLDLIFPHHENEIAQSRCAHGTEMMANYWMHNGYLQLEGRKMSKSEGNFVTIRDLLETEKFGGRKWPGEVLRLAMLMTHYREPIDFSVARLEEAENKLVSWQRAAQLGKETAPDASTIAELADDLNFSRASTVLDAMARKANRGTVSAAHCLATTLEFFGFSTGSLLKDHGGDSASVEAQIDARLRALTAKDFATADAIRNRLLEEGIQLMDYKDPETGERRTKWEIRR